MWEDKVVADEVGIKVIITSRCRTSCRGSFSTSSLCSRRPNPLLKGEGNKKAGHYPAN